MRILSYFLIHTYNSAELRSGLNAARLQITAVPKRKKERGMTVQTISQIRKESDTFSKRPSKRPLLVIATQSLRKKKRGDEEESPSVCISNEMDDLVYLGPPVE